MLTVSLEAMPYLVDHCFFHVPEGWDIADSFPVVPMTTIFKLLGEEAERLVPGKVAIGLRSVRALRWTSAVPPIEVELRASLANENEVKVVLDGYARGTVLLGDTYPDPPAPNTTPMTNERPAPHTGKQLYDDHWMFHGPGYHSVKELISLADDGLRGVAQSLEAPGSLLDAAAQLAGHWVHMSATYNQLALPATVAAVDYYGPHPVVGQQLDCVIRITECEDDHVESDIEMIHEGRLWCRLDKWVERRFKTDDAMFSAMRWPERSELTRRQPAGWWLLNEGWTDSATRELLTRGCTNSQERLEYSKLNPRQQRHWILGRVAVKDAVRGFLADQGFRPVYPVEIGVSNDESGRPLVRSKIPGVDQLSVSLAHTDWLAVALVGDGVPVGIDVEPVADHSERFAQIVLTDEEQKLVPEGAGRDVALTRLWCVKEAASKAVGTGLQGKPKQFAVEAVEGSKYKVSGQWVDTEILKREEGEFVVAWTIN
jgi:phosphopantetheinyl transferase